MLAASILSTIAIGFAAPESKLLALRGGGEISTEKLSTTLSSLYIATGALGFVAPKTNLAGYGMAEKDFSTDVKCFMRCLALGQIVNGATLIAAEVDADKATTVSLTGMALLLLASVPGFEDMDVPKGPIAVWIVVLAALGKASREGKIDATTAAKVSGFFQIVTSVQEILKPSITYDAYKMPRPSNLGEMLFQGFAWNKLGNGLFVLLGKTQGKSLGLAVSLACSAANCFKIAVGDTAENAGVKKAGPLAWGVLQGAMGALAYKNSQA
jgi:hypothetical protein